MANHKVNVLDKKVPTAFSISRRTNIAFRERCRELGLSASTAAEEIILEFLKG